MSLELAVLAPGTDTVVNLMVFTTWIMDTMDIMDIMSLEMVLLLDASQLQLITVADQITLSDSRKDIRYEGGGGYLMANNSCFADLIEVMDGVRTPRTMNCNIAIGAKVTKT